MDNTIQKRILKANLVYERIGAFIDYLNEFENQCAYTDSLISSALQILNELETEIANEIDNINS